MTDFYSTFNLNVIEKSIEQDMQSHFNNSSSKKITLHAAAREASTCDRVTIFCKCKKECNAHCRCKKNDKECTQYCYTEEYECDNLPDDILMQTEVSVIEKGKGKGKRPKAKSAVTVTAIKRSHNQPTTAVPLCT